MYNNKKTSLNLNYKPTINSNAVPSVSNRLTKIRLQLGKVITFIKASQQNISDKDTLDTYREIARDCQSIQANLQIYQNNQLHNQDNTPDEKRDLKEFSAPTFGSQRMIKAIVKYYTQPDLPFSTCVKTYGLTLGLLRGRVKTVNHICKLKHIKQPNKSQVLKIIKDYNSEVLSAIHDVVNHKDSINKALAKHKLPLSTIEILTHKPYTFHDITAQYDRVYSQQLIITNQNGNYNFGLKE